jgi:signal transduction histidine kinase
MFVQVEDVREVLRTTHSDRRAALTDVGLAQHAWELIVESFFNVSTITQRVHITQTTDALKVVFL